MAEFSGVWRCRGSVLMKLEAMLEAREATREEEVTAAAKIQRMYRAKVARGDLNRARRAVTFVAKTFRGYRGRMRAQRALEERQAKETMTVYHHHALVIQGAYRGCQSRKYKYSHFNRKRYLQEVIDAGDAVRAELRRHERQLMEEEAAKIEHDNRAKFQAIAQNLHHLVSTKTINGVFNSPYHSGHHRSRRSTTTDRIPTVQGVPVEKYLTISSKDLLRTRGYVKRGLETDLNGQRRIPLRGLKNRRSVQAESPYDAMARATALEEAFSRLKRIGPREFHAGYRVHLPPYQGGVNTGIPFMDPWRNPYMVRGVPRNQAELSRPIEETSLGKYPEKPFHRSVGGNRSAVLPNGIFDIILDAEQTGGTVRTHNGRTRRFGVPDSCDVDDRVIPGTTLYFPPIPPGNREKSMTIL